MTAMTEPTENGVTDRAVEPVESEPAAVKDETSLVETFENTLELSQDVKLTEEKGSREKLEQEDGQTICLPAAETFTSESKWEVGAPCQAVWSEDGLVYPATVVSLDAERCRVHFNSYGNEEDVELSALQRLRAAPCTQRQSAQDWSPGSRCRAVYSEDGLVYPAMVLWVKGQRCRVRFDDYNNEEEQDISSLLNPDELHGASRSTTKGSSWKSISINNSDWKRGRREEKQEERRGERRDDHSFSWQGKERPGPQSKEREEKKRGHQQREEAEKPTNHSFSLFPPFPPPPQSSSGDPLSFIPPPPPPPLWTFGGKESSSSTGVDSTSSMLMLWYMCGFHTGSFMAQQLLRSTSKD
ncbi:survival motor neuron protein-like isoform X1 [Seriola aureovittata]|uniref:survival motor neuron protein-like isoform X1 n=1 Tax=Seriola aureovittata TaxID=2871759 RepID=UPI0024BDB2DB|nr:survival motor neuron protein-like isoform X1 [Seriola aureovittata]